MMKSILNIKNVRNLKVNSNLRILVQGVVHGRVHGFASSQEFFKNASKEEIVFVERDCEEYSKVLDSYELKISSKFNADLYELIEYSKKNKIFIQPCDLNLNLVKKKVFLKALSSPSTWFYLWKFPRFVKCESVEDVENFLKLESPFQKILFDEREEYMSLVIYSKLKLTKDYKKVSVFCGPAHVGKIAGNLKFLFENLDDAKIEVDSKIELKTTFSFLNLHLLKKSVESEISKKINEEFEFSSLALIFLLSTITIFSLGFYIDFKIYKFRRNNLNFYASETEKKKV